MLGVLKRLFVGRPLATTQMEEQRLSKTIALAVFSSDALSSTAYATEEILFVTALGASSLALGLSKLVPIAIVVVHPARDRDHVVPAGDLRLPQRRRRVRRQQGEHRRVRRSRRRRVADGRLRADGGGVDLGRCRRDRLDPRVRGPPRSARPARRGPDRGDHAPEHARGQGIRPHLRHPHLRLHARARGADHGRARAVVLAATAPRCRSTPTRSTAACESGGVARDLPAAQGVLVGRGRAHRRRGDLQRRARVPASRVEERGRHPRVDGGAARARCSSACRCWRTTSSRTRATTRR